MNRLAFVLQISNTMNLSRRFAAAGSVVLADVAPHTTVAGVPAKVVGKPCSEQPALDMNHALSPDMANV